MATLKFLLKFIPLLENMKTAYEQKEVFIVTNDLSAPINFFELKTSEIIANSIEVIKKMYYPLIDTLVCNAIIVSIENISIFTQRMAFDFLSKHMPLNNSLIQNEEKIKIAIAACKSLQNADMSISRRIHSWLFEANFIEDIHTKMLFGLLDQIGRAHV